MNFAKFVHYEYKYNINVMMLNKFAIRVINEINENFMFDCIQIL